MISLSGISKNYGEQHLFSDVTLSLQKGEKCGLTGRNGHGKTTLLRIIAGTENPDSGSVSIPKGYRIGYLRQGISFSKSNILDEVTDNLPDVKHGETWIAEKTLAGLGFSENDMERPPSEYSGGYKMRIELARVLVSEPDLLLLDEPTNFLDIVSIIWLERFLTSWKGEMILITHNRSFMDSTTETILGIHRKRLRRLKGNTEDYYNKIRQEEEIHRKQRINQEKKVKQMEEFVSKFRAKARQASLVQSRIKTLNKMQKKQKLSAVKSLSFSFSYLPLKSKEFFEAKDLAFSYTGKPPYLFEGLSFSIDQGDKLCIIGKNGKGKSTLLKNITGALNPVKGSIKTHNSLSMGYYAQTASNTLRQENTVLEEIASGFTEYDEKRAREICGVMMFSGDDALKKIKVISGGEKCRVLLGKTAASPSNLLLLDEPTQHLDIQSVEALIDAVNEFPGAALIVTHDERLLKEVSDKVIVFKEETCSLYPKPYTEYIREHPWEDINTSSVNLKTGKKQEKKESKINKKEQRRIKAEMVHKRNRYINPIKKRIRDLEQKIETCEEDHSSINRRLIELSEASDGTGITEESKKLAETEERINSLYSRLEKACEELEAKEAELEGTQESIR